MKLTSPSAITAFLREHNLSALKQFGQNFLCDANIVRKIAVETGADKEHGVLEIGMGLGALTMELAELAKSVVAVEIDRGLIATRGDDIRASGNVKIVEGDILETDLRSIWKADFGSEPFYVCGNLPYYITGRILIRVLESGLPILRFTAMVQKEVAERLCASPGDSDYGAATAYADYFSRPKILFTVSRRCFYPSPDVDSAIIALDLSSDHPDVPFEAYRQIVRQAFSMRRKTLQNNFKALLGSEKTADVLQQADIDPRQRAQETSCGQFVRLTELFLEAGWTPSASAQDDTLLQ